MKKGKRFFPRTGTTVLQTSKPARSRLFQYINDLHTEKTPSVFDKPGFTIGNDCNGREDKQNKRKVDKHFYNTLFPQIEWNAL